MIIHVHFNGDSLIKSRQSELGSEPTTFQLTSNCQEITLLTRVCISAMNHFALFGSHDSKPPTEVAGNISTSLYV